MIRLFAISLVALALAGPRSGLAQSQTLADIRQELTVLHVELQKLLREMSTTGTVSGTAAGGSTLDRLNAIENELQRVTSKTEEMEFRIDRIVKDGTNRIGDLEFRLVELEGGDVSQLGETSTLGGGELPPAAPLAPVEQPETQLAEQEKADFERAQAALANGDFRAAADQFTSFNQTYPGGPLAVESELRRGQALEGLGDVREGARAYLAAFSLDAQSPFAPEVLFRLGAALGRLGQTTEACLTLLEVDVRYPASPYVAEAEATRLNLACS